MEISSLLPSPRNCARGTQRHARILLSVPLMLHHLVPGGIRVTRGISLDISEGGLGALVRGGLQVGETVSLELKLPNYGLRAVAIVRYSSGSRSGFEFLGLTPAEREHLAGFVGST